MMIGFSGSRIRATANGASGRWRAAAAIVLLLLGSMQSAHAYLDPGTGSILLQGLIAGVAATAAYIGIYWRRIKAFFSPRSRSDEGTAAKPDPPSQDNPH